MDQLLQTFLESSQGLVAYLSIFGVLLACGLGVPLPEDVSLLLGGYLVHEGAAVLPVMIAVGFLGILSGDSLIYLAGRRIGSKVAKRPGGVLGRIITPQKMAKVEGMFARHGQKIVMIARFLPGVRAVTYFTAGSAGMSYSHFIFFDGVAALASAPLFVYLGYHFGGELNLLVQNVRRGQVQVISLLVAAILAYVLVGRVRARRAAAVAKAEALAEADPTVPVIPAGSTSKPDAYQADPPRFTQSGPVTPAETLK